MICAGSAAPVSATFGAAMLGTATAPSAVGSAAIDCWIFAAPSAPTLPFSSGVTAGPAGSGAFGGGAGVGAGFSGAPPVFSAALAVLGRFGAVLVELLVRGGTVRRRRRR